MFKFTCYPDGGEPFTVLARSRAIAAWENAPGQPKGTRRSVGDLTERLKMTDMIELAWFAADKAGQTGLDLSQWKDQVDVDLEPYDDEEEGPTGVAP